MGHAELLARGLRILPVAEAHERAHRVTAADPLPDVWWHRPVREHQPGAAGLARVGEAVEHVGAKPFRAEQKQRVLPGDRAGGAQTGVEGDVEQQRMGQFAERRNDRDQKPAQQADDDPDGDDPGFPISELLGCSAIACNL